MMTEHPSRQRILLVDDDANFRRVLTLRLEAEGYHVEGAASGEEALQRLEETTPQFVLADLRMPGMDGIDLLAVIQSRHPGLPAAVMTAHGDIPEAVRATQEGAVDFLTKPVERGQLLECLRRHAAPQPDTVMSGAWGGEMVTRSPRMQAVINDAQKVAATDAAVLLTGASGTGKEVMARAIHQASLRAKRSFVALNCAAVPAELLESELFGHKRGAFTGASQDHAGLFRAADGGTLLLDEIGDMPLDLQSKLLRVLQEQAVRPVGETRTMKVDVRVISATHRDLMAMVHDGEFREDLYYRLDVVSLHLPTLDERREDIPILAARKLKQLAGNTQRRRVYSPEAMELLVAASWPGNIRQLFNVVEQNAVFATSRVIGPGVVRKALGATRGALPSFAKARAEFTRSYLRQLLEFTDGNVSRAARLAERNRSDFYKLLDRHDIDPADFKTTTGG